MILRLLLLHTYDYVRVHSGSYSGTTIQRTVKEIEGIELHEIHVLVGLDYDRSGVMSHVVRVSTPRTQHHCRQ